MPVSLTRLLQWLHEIFWKHCHKVGEGVIARFTAPIHFRVKQQVEPETVDQRLYLSGCRGWVDVTISAALHDLSA